MPYKLSATLAAHSADVRALSTPLDQLILSASRDSTAIYWQRSPSDTSFAPETVLKAGSRYVNAVAYLPPDSQSSKGYAVTAGQDAVINIFSLQTPKDEPNYCLIGHTENVCTLDVTPGGTIISGSWDRTAKVWKGFQLAYELKGHEQAVWAVLAVDETQVLTGSADKTIKLWQQHKVLHTFTGHQDAVRGLSLLPDIGFASCSNDSEIRVWTLGGDTIYTLSGHTSFVYSVATLPSGDIVSSGEDRTVRVWRDGECEQTIVHPAISVWAVSTMPNGDIVSGSSDNIVRVFSASEERWASAEALKEYDDAVASQALPSQQIGDVKKDDLPGLDALAHPGRKAGEVKMVRNGTVVEAHQWDTASNSWQKIGDVVDAVGQGRKQLYEGKEYDYVFDVDIQDGVPPLKLPYNVAENPYSAAQRFLERNELAMSYLDQVVRFIEQNTRGETLGGGENYSDPFTGGSRYRPAGNTPSAGATYADPFTGASRYTPAGSTPTPAPVTPTASSTSKILPVSKQVTFKQANVSAMQGKFFQLNEALRAEISTASLSMYPEEITLIDEVFTSLSLLTSTPPPTQSVPPPTAAHVETLLHVLDRWPSAQRFPVIDLTRLVVGYYPELFKPVSAKTKLTDALFRACEWTAPWTGQVPKARETNILLLFRTLANVFDEKTQSDQGYLDTLLQTLAQAPYTALNKTPRVALATILFNISCEGLKFPLDPGVREKTFSLIAKILEQEAADAEAVYRALVAVGNLVYASKGSVKAAQVGEISQTLKILPKKFNDVRVKNICAEILSL